MFRQDKNPPAGLTSLALHHAMTLQISEFVPLPETRAAAGRVFRGTGRGRTSGLGMRLRLKLLGFSLLRPLAAFFSEGHAGAGSLAPRSAGTGRGQGPPTAPQLLPGRESRTTFPSSLPGRHRPFPAGPGARPEPRGGGGTTARGGCAPSGTTAPASLRARRRRPCPPWLTAQSPPLPMPLPPRLRTRLRTRVPPRPLRALRRESGGRAAPPARARPCRGCRWAARAGRRGCRCRGWRSRSSRPSTTPGRCCSRGCAAAPPCSCTSSWRRSCGRCSGPCSAAPSCTPSRPRWRRWAGAGWAACTAPAPQCCWPPSSCPSASPTTAWRRWASRCCGGGGSCCCWAPGARCSTGSTAWAAPWACRCCWHRPPASSARGSTTSAASGWVREGLCVGGCSAAAL